jgi:hypothetical protein
VLLRRSDDIVVGMHQSGDAMIVDVTPRPPSSTTTSAWRFAMGAR